MSSTRGTRSTRSTRRTLRRGLAAAACTLACAASLPAQAQADPAAVTAVVAEVKARNPDFAALCKSGADNIRKSIVGVVMGMASRGNLNDPMGAGMAAGARIREECPKDPSTTQGTSAADIRWLTVDMPALAFDPQARELGSFSSLSNRVFKPAGDGPFPAVVLMHTNGGIGHAHMRRTARVLIEQGYVVLLTDSFEARGAKAGSVMPAQGVKDAYAALAYLHAQPYVNKARIFQAGYSWGAYVSAMVASPQGAAVFKSAQRFRASVSNYGSCLHQDAPGSAALELLSEDSDRPVLMLMAERDIEAPPQHCFPRLEKMKTTGRPVQWHVYPGVTHAWDKREQSGYTYRHASGETMTYTYDEAATADALRRMLAFFAEHP